MEQNPDLRDVLGKIEELSERVDELTRGVERIQLIVCGNGIDGLADRISAVEASVCFGERSILARIAHLERTLDAALTVLRGILIAIGSAIALAVLQLVVPLLK